VEADFPPAKANPIKTHKQEANYEKHITDSSGSRHRNLHGRVQTI
jgi:hypothetical protein